MPAFQRLIDLPAVSDLSTRLNYVRAGALLYIPFPNHESGAYIHVLAKQEFTAQCFD
jgi:hypothetical protein